jgi:hypothetical protein
LVLILADVVDRSLFHSSLLWTEEIAQLALTVVAFVGGAVAFFAFRESCYVPIPQRQVPEHVCKRPDIGHRPVFEFDLGNLFRKSDDFLAHMVPLVD